MVFANFCSPLCTLEEHTARMRYETVWGTDLEIKVAATYFQLPIYVCTHLLLGMLSTSTLQQPSISSPSVLIFETPFINALDHLELCHSDRCHHDTVVMSDGLKAHLHRSNLHVLECQYLEKRGPKIQVYVISCNSSITSFMFYSTDYIPDACVWLH